MKRKFIVPVRYVLILFLLPVGACHKFIDIDDLWHKQIAPYTNNHYEYWAHYTHDVKGRTIADSSYTFGTFPNGIRCIVSTWIGRI